MAKHTTLDLKKTAVDRNPETGYSRIKAGDDGQLYIIDSENNKRLISSPWELPVKSITVNDPQLITPQTYDRYIVPESALNEWSGHDNKIAYYNANGEWVFVEPAKGWVVYNEEDNRLYSFDGLLWDNAAGYSDTGVDDITIKTQDGFKKMSKEPTIKEALAANWVPDLINADIYEHSTIHEGRMDCHPGISTFYEITNNNASWPAGVYEFYCNIDLVPYGIGFWVGTLKYFTSVYENGLYRHTVTLEDGDDPATFDCNIKPLDVPASIWFINRFDDTIEEVITVKNVDYVIGSLGVSIDGSSAPSTAPEKELVSKKYVDVNKYDPDDITLQKIFKEPITGTQSDIQVWFKENWDNTAPDSGWMLNSNFAFNNGVLTIPAGTDLSDINNNTVLENTTGDSWAGGFFRLITNIDIEGLGLIFEIQNPSGVAPSSSSYYDQKLLDNGEYEVSFYLGADGVFSKLFLQGSVVLSEDMNIRLVDMEQYPPIDMTSIKNIDHIIDNTGLSIDGSDTPMQDSHRELVTRAFIEDKIDSESEVDNITVEKRTGFKATATENSIEDILVNNWEPNAATGGWISQIVSDGVIQGTSGTDSIFDDDAGADPLFTAGTYEFYSNKDLVPYGIQLWDGSNNGPIYFTSVFENGLYRHSATLSTDTIINGMYFDGSSDTSFSIWIINKFDDSTNAKITVKDVNWIIDLDGKSIDDFNADAVDSAHEIPTRRYVDGNIADADEITVHKTDFGYEITSNNDVETVFHDAWNSSFDTSGWSLNDSVHSYSNGTFSIDFTSNNIGDEKIMTHSSGDTVTRGVYKVICNASKAAEGFDVMLQDTTNDVLSGLYNEVDLGNGTYMYDIYTPDTMNVDNMIRTGSYSGGTLEMTLIDMNSYPLPAKYKIKEIDHIIDDDHESIDGSNTPMSDPHRELVTRGYVEAYVSAEAYWLKEDSSTGFGQQLVPADSDVKRIEIKNDSRGFNDIYIQNALTGDNYTGASITLTVDSADYTNQTFISHHGPDYYQPQLRSRGAIMTDSSMFIGAYNSTDQQGEPAFVAFIVGDDYYNQKEIFRLTTNGLEMPLSDKKIWYEAGKTVQEHPSDYTSLFCNVATSEIYAGQPLQAGSVRLITNENITLSGVQTIDGVDTEAGDRIAVFSQDDGTENGLYVAADGAWSRALDFKEGSSVSGTTFVVNQGALYQDSLWMVSSDKPNDVVGTDELEVKLIGGSKTVSSSYTVRLLESVFNIDVNSLPTQIDYTDIKVGDKICLAAQNDARENGVYEVISDTQAVRVPELQNGIAVAGFMFVVNEGCLNSDTLWIFSNDEGSDTIGVNDLTLLKISFDGSIEKTENKVLSSLDEANQFIDLQETPLPNYHIQVFINGALWSMGNDYDISDNRVIFYNEINEGDIAQFYYRYIPGGHCTPPEPPSPSFEFDAVMSDSGDLDLLIGYIGTTNQVEIDWGDGNTDTYGVSQTNVTHTYGDIGTYRVKITGQSNIKFSDGTQYDRQIIVQHWGDNANWADLRGMFQNMTNILLSSDDVLNPTNPIPANDMFRDAVNFDSDIIGVISFTNLTDISGMFAGASSFDKDLSSININNGHITNLDYLFQDATSFNQNINLWDVSTITSMNSTFKNASNFNQPLDQWDTSNVTNMTSMFEDNTLFNQDISGWDISSVTDCDKFRLNAALDCDNTPLLPAACTGCFNDFKFNVTVNSGDQLYFGNIQSKGDTDLIVDWGDGNVDNLGTSYSNNLSHTYNTSGTYLVKIHGHKYVKLQGSTLEIKIIHWGDNSAWERLDYMFASMTNLTIETDDILAPTNDVNADHMFYSCPNFNCNLDQYIDTSNFTYMGFFLQGCSVFNGTVNGFNMSKNTSLSAFFNACYQFNQPVDNWNTSNVTDFRSIFYRCYQFNQPVNTWNTSGATSLAYTFAQCSVFDQDLDNWNTSNVTDMQHMFDGALVFNSDVTTWDASKVTNMDSMFKDARVFNQDIGNWGVSAVTTLRRAFNNCYEFNQDLSSWSTSDLANMTEAFRECHVFNKPLDTWDVSNVTDMSSTFYNCKEFNQPLNSWDTSSLTTLDSTFAGCSVFNQDLDNWNVSNVTTLRSTFTGCGEFNGNISTWDTQNVTNMNSTFNRCYKFNQNIDSWNVSKVTDFYGFLGYCSEYNQPMNSWVPSSAARFQNMFYRCTNFNQDLNNWDMTAATNIAGMFNGCSVFDGDITTWNISNVTYMAGMFYEATDFNQDISGWNTSSVTDMNSLFVRAENFNRPIGSWDVSSVTNFSHVFEGASAFDQELDSWNVSSATNMASMFASASSFNRSLNSWDVSNVTSMYAMFFRASNFNQDLSNWNTSNVTNMQAMFYIASAFNGNITTWDVSNVTTIAYMFASAYVFAQDISNWDISSVTNMNNTFSNADTFNIDISSWNTSNVTDMTSTFNNNDAFNQNISGWDVSAVVSCSNFRGGTSVLECANTPALPSTCTGC